MSHSRIRLLASAVVVAASLFLAPREASAKQNCGDTCVACQCSSGGCNNCCVWIEGAWFGCWQNCGGPQPNPCS